uniref:PDZ domain-containing protein n=1 Tax=Pundamilia nyererei TaxID=303518 RepID=A0A3B4FQM9_9CICH
MRFVFVRMTGDRLLEVDRSNLRGVTHHQAVEFLKRTGEHVAKDHNSHVNAQVFPFISFLENTREVVLRKSLSGLGFSFYISQLHSGPDRSSVVRIKRLFPGQPAQESGLLREGDIILTVNKDSNKGFLFCLSQRVLLLLRGAPSEVHLLICRPGPGALNDGDNNSLTNHCTFCLTLQTLTSLRDARSRSLDIRLGEDYSELLKKPSNQEEELTSKTEKNSELPAASQLPESQEDLKAEVALVVNGRASTVWRWCQVPLPARRVVSNPMTRSCTSVEGARWE